MLFEAQINCGQLTHRVAHAVDHKPAAEGIAAAAIAGPVQATLGRIMERVTLQIPVVARLQLRQAAHEQSNLDFGADRMVQALLAAHLLEPDLHKMLELQFPYFDAPQSENEADQGIFKRVRALLQNWRNDIAPPNLDLATWVVLQIMESMVHAAVIEAPGFDKADIEASITNAVMGYLTYRPNTGIMYSI